MANNTKSTTTILFDQMLEQIRAGQWSVGNKIPSERTLMEEFGVSRVSVRETLSMLRALGILSTSQGKQSVVQQMDSKLLGKIFPLIFSLEGEKTYRQIFEVRLALESRTAYLAALNRTEEDIVQLNGVLQVLKTQLNDDLDQSIGTDLLFHKKIAYATGNPLFPALLETLSGFVEHSQVISCKDDPAGRERAFDFHQSISDAITDRDPERARVEMESHLRSSADRVLKSGVLSSTESLIV